MKSVNKWHGIGNLGRDPEKKFTSGETPRAITKFTMACNESWTDRDGQKQERVEWVRVVVWGKLGELAAEYLAKGRQVYVEGRLQTRNWDDEQGNKRYITEVIADDLVFLGGRGDSGFQPENENQDRGGFDDSDVPF